VDVAEGDVAHDRWFVVGVLSVGVHVVCGRLRRRSGGHGARSARAYGDVDGAGNVLENDVGEGDVFVTGAGVSLELDGAAVNVVQDAVGDGDVFGEASAEAEDGPAGAEDAVGDGDEFAASEEGAGVILREDDAVVDGDVLGADEVEAVVVAVDAVMDVDGVHVDAFGSDDADAVISAIDEVDVADGEVFALIGEYVVGTLVAADPAGRRGTANLRVELSALTVDGARAFDGDVLLPDSVEESPVAVDEGGVATKGDGVYGVILLAVGASKEFCGGGDVEGNVAFELGGANEEGSAGNEDGAATVCGAGVDGGLECGGVEGGAVAFSSVVADVVDARAEDAGGCSGLGGVCGWSGGGHGSHDGCYSGEWNLG